MPADGRFPKPEKPAIWSLLPPAMVAILLLVALGESFEWHPAFLEPSRNEVFRLDSGAWHRLPGLPGDPAQLRVSSAGTVWTLVPHYKEPAQLARLDGATWRVFGPPDFGACRVDSSVGFALDGEDVWAVGHGVVLHFDGLQWTCAREAFADGVVSSIVAAGGQLWVIDVEGNLSHFDGSQWATRHVELPGAKWGDHPWPLLARTADGSLWIARNGLWRSKGPDWVSVKPGGEDLKGFDMVGSTPEGVWLFDGERLVLAGPYWTLRELRLRDVGLERGVAVTGVAQAGPRTRVATSKGILESDGTGWRMLAGPGNGVRGVVDVGMGAHGGLLAIGNISNPAALRWQFLQPAIPLVLLLGLAATPVWAVRRYKHRQWREHVRLQQAVAHATGAVPEEFARDERLLARQSSWWSATLTVVVIVGAMLTWSITRTIWPAAPPWMFLPIAFALHAVVALGQSMVRRTPRPWDPIEPGRPGFDWGPARRAVPATLAVFFLMNLGAFPKWMGDPFVWLFCALALAAWFRMAGETLRIRALRRGDYERALKLVRRFRFYNPDGGAALMWRGHVLVSAGRFREAEETLRLAVARLRSRSAQARALEFLGDALLEQARYGEAQRSYEAAVHAVPGYRRPYRGLAELALRRHDPARALEYVESILGPSGSAWNRWTINQRAHDDYWALRAWALAELGRGAEVPEAAALALRATNSNSPPCLAATYRRLGMAMKALDRQSEAEDYFKRARNADPNGRWSAQARTMLGEKSVFRV